MLFLNLIYRCFNCLKKVKSYLSCNCFKDKDSNGFVELVLKVKHEKEQIVDIHKLKQIKEV